MTKQQQFSQNLRNLADWYDQHPTAPAPVEKLRTSTYVRAEEIASLPDGMDEFKPSASEITGGQFARTIDGDGFEVRFYSALKNIAAQVVVGTRTADVVEWIIKPELLPTQELVAAGISDDDIPW